MESLETTITHWERALDEYRSSEGGGPLVLLGPEEVSFCKDLQLLLEEALNLQDRSEMLFLDERSILFRPGSGARVSENECEAEISGGESFASAQDMVIKFYLRYNNPKYNNSYDEVQILKFLGIQNTLCLTGDNLTLYRIVFHIWDKPCF